MNKRGFTLIELLAVILVLAIIALIGTVSVNNIVEQSRKDSFKASVRSILRSGENFYSVELLNPKETMSFPSSFTCNGKECSNGKSKLEFTGKAPESGTIIIDDKGNVGASYVSDGKFCASGNKEDLQVVKGCAEIDITKPQISGSLSKDTLKLKLIDKESGIDSYCVTESNEPSRCEWVKVNNDEVEHKLSKTGTYTAFAKDKKGNISPGVSFTTGDIEKPVVTGTLDVDTIKLILTDTGSGIKGYCVTEKDNDNTCMWIDTEEGYVEYKLTKSGTYYVFAKDKNSNISNSVKFATGDIEVPTLTVSQNQNVITLYYEDNVGVTRYCFTSSDDSNTCSWLVTEGTSVNHTLTKSGTYYIFVKDNAGNISTSVVLDTGDIEKPVVTGTLNKNKVALVFTDDVGVTKYCVNKTTRSSECNWIDVSGNNTIYAFTEAGSFYIFASDAAGNISDYLTYAIAKESICSAEPGQEFDFAYKGSVEEWEVPCTGLYKLEVFGAQGGSTSYYNGSGGWWRGVSSGGATGAKAQGYIKLNSGDIIYVVVGGAGGGTSYVGAGAGAAGYNGGGAGGGSNSGDQIYSSSAGGGGATHIGTATGLISDATAWENVIIVAGGGAGSRGSYWNPDASTYGGSTAPSSNNVKGQGSGGSYSSISGGGGYYGGNYSYSGTNYIGGVPEIEYKGTKYSPTTQQGVNSGNGKAKITFVSD